MYRPIPGGSRNTSAASTTLPGMAQDTDTTDPHAPSVPTFGRHDAPMEERRYRRFGLEVEGRRRPGTPEERWTEEFDCFTEVDGGSWVLIGQARSDMEMARAIVSFMGVNLRDDDGAPMDYSTPVQPELADPEDPESDWLRGDPTDAEPDGVPLYLGWDGEVYPSQELPELDELRDGSSRRRFAYISDAMAIRYRYEALEEVSAWLTEGMTGRPTRRPANSGGGPRQTGRGSGARRR